MLSVVYDNSPCHSVIVVECMNYLGSSADYGVRHVSGRARVRTPSIAIKYILNNIKSYCIKLCLQIIAFRQNN